MTKNSFKADHPGVNECGQEDGERHSAPGKRKSRPAHKPIVSRAEEKGCPVMNRDQVFWVPESGLAAAYGSKSGGKASQATASRRSR